ncbi:glycosyltransferase [Thermoactinospora rubra]|uniref:glycosyltransferase n=1 Tax=Thermoactinospora rubra TaxID=1088767 RepID=UPI000A101EBF|nr:glycosyltransferase [Thermoactinospora rubra]
MNIAIVSSAGGTRRHQILSAARELGHEHRVTIYSRRQCPDGKDRVRVAPGVVVEHLTAGPPRPLQPDEAAPYLPLVSRQLAQRWREDPPDVIHAYSWTGGLAAVAGSKDLGVPIMQSLCHRLPPAHDTPQHLKLERALGRRADTVIAGCGDEESELVRLGVPRDHITVVPYGVDTGRFHRHGPAAARGGRPRLLHVGGVTPEDGAHTVIRTMAGLPDVELVVAGGPPPEQLGDDPEIARLRALAEQIGVAERVTLLGRVPRSSVPRLMRGADIVLTLPRETGTGSVALEAMACGVPVVASAVGAHLDSVIDGVTGLLVPPDRPAHTARLTRELLADPTRRTALGYAGADRARSRYSWDRISHELLRVYEDALAAH